VRNLLLVLLCAAGLGAGETGIYCIGNSVTDTACAAEDAECPTLIHPKSIRAAIRPPRCQQHRRPTSGYRPISLRISAIIAIVRRP
jgi:hypothetical protein